METINKTIICDVLSQHAKTWEVTALWKNFLADDILKYFSYFSQDWHSIADNLHEMSIMFSGKNKKDITNLLSAELAQKVVKVNNP